MKCLSILMKRLFKQKALYTWTIIFSLSIAACSTENACAQVSFGVQISIPTWAPHYTEVNAVQYYYLPDIEVYYDVWNDQYVYLDNGVWVYSRGLPPRYADYDLYSGHVIVLEKGIHNPWVRHRVYASHYPGHSLYGRYQRHYYVEHSGEYHGHHGNYRERVVAPRNSMNGNTQMHAPRSSMSYPQQQGGGRHEQKGHGNGHRR